jgi:hypothetical protein
MTPTEPRLRILCDIEQFTSAANHLSGGERVT